jgi:DUF4097 and DUF4098 domain-containing protein YvlB
MLLIALTSYVDCNGQHFKSEVRGKKIYIKSEGRVVDSIGLYSPRYSKQLIHGSSIYYTDGIITPDRVTIKLFKAGINGSHEVKNALIRSLYREREEFIDIKLSSGQVTLRFRDEKGRKKVTHKISSLLE